MLNLLRDEIPLSQLLDTFAASPARPLLPPSGDAAWQHVAANPLLAGWLRELHRRAALAYVGVDVIADCTLNSDREVHRDTTVHCLRYQMGG